ncbi:MAG: class A beta-lactamase-related serine hydrolase [Acidobacteria bacterium]|nr:MAG: class A beta-lactamase-related serine hydrolase [Acidobacteriota bacterium]
MPGGGRPRGAGAGARDPRGDHRVSVRTAPRPARLAGGGGGRDHGGVPARSPEPHPEIERWIVRHARAGHWPGAAYAVGEPFAPRWGGAAGSLALEPSPEPARPDALYDLASLTKALVTAPLLLLLARDGVLDPDEPVDRWLPEMKGYAGRTPSYTDLMAHRAGLPAWAPLYRLARSADDVPRAVAALPPGGTPGKAPVYSCLGPILAGIAMERATGRPLAELFRERLAAALDLGETEIRFGPLPGGLRRRAAPTEAGRRHEEAMAGGCPRGRDDVPLRGEVHDGNAAFLGGAAGNAGLFGTAEAVHRLASALAVPGPLFDDREVERFRRPAARGGGDVRTFGFRSGLARTAPAGALGPSSFGHVGFTGTSVWIEPSRPLVAVLLSNRIHPEWREAPVQRWRREFHDLVAGSGA